MTTRLPPLPGLTLFPFYPGGRKITVQPGASAALTDSRVAATPLSAGYGVAQQQASPEAIAALLSGPVLQANASGQLSSQPVDTSQISALLAFNPNPAQRGAFLEATTPPAQAPSIPEAFKARAAFFDVSEANAETLFQRPVVELPRVGLEILQYGGGATVLRQADGSIRLENTAQGGIESVRYNPQLLQQSERLSDTLNAGPVDTSTISARTQYRSSGVQPVATASEPLPLPPAQALGASASLANQTAQPITPFAPQPERLASLEQRLQETASRYGLNLEGLLANPALVSGAVSQSPAQGLTVTGPNAINQPEFIRSLVSQNTGLSFTLDAETTDSLQALRQAASAESLRAATQRARADGYDMAQRMNGYLPPPTASGLPGMVQLSVTGMLHSGSLESPFEKSDPTGETILHADVLDRQGRSYGQPSMQRQQERQPAPAPEGLPALDNPALATARSGAVSVPKAPRLSPQWHKGADSLFNPFLK